MEERPYFFFDLDGLLINSEPLYWGSLQSLFVKEFSTTLRASLEEYEAAINNVDGLEHLLIQKHPELRLNHTMIENLRAKRRQSLPSIAQNTSIQWMKGAEQFLYHQLKAAAHKCCIVTNSPLEFVEIAKRQLPILEKVPLWITREDVTKYKPDPEGYLLAKKKLSVGGEDLCFGFEDTQKGALALSRANIKPILVKKKATAAEIAWCQQANVWLVDSLETLSTTWP